jgi:serine/threonine protein kinase
MSDDENRQSTELPTIEAGPTPDETARQIGPYRLLDKLGEGGMGEVWLAEQTEPVKRKVALKLIKQGMDTKQVVARFEAERQALAMMDHPAIAKIYDAGATPRGRPYFAMEYVQGLPITEHCDRHTLTNRQRLELFLQVCEGVQHAHHKAVIHRDLKPSNVLVSILDDKPVPKVIDFGVAKATAQRLTDRTMHTQLGVLIGTPAYMSPEQAEMTGQDIDTRTDVYALGVMLYELLVGALPFDSEEFQRVGLEAIVRKIREDDPPKPSTRLSTLGKHSTESAVRRRTEFPALRRELSGDLDWITMKALEKDRKQRYSSLQEFAADIERYLTDQPVLASPPSAAYRARKFVKRHTWGVVAATAVALVLPAITLVMTIQAGRIASERDRANAEAARANQEAEAKGQVSEFLKDLFTVSDPGEARGNSITARELLDKGAEKIEGMVEEQPETGAELMDTMGTVYQKLGLYPQAEPLLERALAERRRVLGEDHPDTLGSMNHLADLYGDQGRHDEAEPLLLEALETSRRVLGDDHPYTASTLYNLACLEVPLATGPKRWTGYASPSTRGGRTPTSWAGTPTSNLCTAPSSTPFRGF